ncbi:MAG: tetratricopeptide repeat protein, partial [Bacteroidales bacterium]|nr:tetratricopeptide repeat protein [Bacteroidales bacterium]
MFRSYLVFFALLFANLFCYADDIDSLKNLIAGTNDERDLINLQFQLAEKYNIAENPKDYYLTVNKALRLAESVGEEMAIARANRLLGEYFFSNQEIDFSSEHYHKALAIYRDIGDQKTAAEILFDISAILFNSSNYPGALQYANESMEIFREIDDKKNLANVHSLLCDIYSYMGVNEKAIDNCIQSLRLFDELNVMDTRANLLNSIGSIYLDMGQFDRSEEYFNDALFMANTAGDAYMIVTSVSNLGEMHLQLENYEEALKYFNRALDIDMNENDEEGLGYSYLNLGNTYYQMGDYEKALEYLGKSLTYADRSVDLEMQATVYSQIGSVYSELGNYRMAINYLKKSLSAAQKINADPILLTCYNNLAKYYDKLGDQKNALIYFKLVLLLTEEMIKNQSAQEIAETEAIYNLSKKEQEIQLLRSENRIKDLEASEKTLMNIWLITGLVVSLTFIVVVYRQYKEQNKMNQTLQVQKEELKLAKEEIQLQRDDIEKTNRSLEDKNKQVTDSIEYAKRIQLSLLPDNELLRECFEDSFVLYLPRDIVSGDFYWITTIERKTYLAVLDCTGHGVPGAFMTVMANTLLSQIVLENKITEPNSMVKTLDQKIIQSLNQHGITLSPFEGMDMSLCMIDADTNLVSFTGAKLPMYYVHKGKFDLLEGDRFSIGGNEYREKSYKIKNKQLDKGDIIYLATDGFQDQFGG